MSAIFPTGWMVPTSPTAIITETRIVSSRIAASTSSGFTNPSASTGRLVTSKPRRSRYLSGVMTERCSTTDEMMCLPLDRDFSATPFRAMLLASVAPEVKTISAGVAPVNPATRSRASSSAWRAASPSDRNRIDGFPKCSVIWGIIASTTRGSTGDADW